MQYASMVLDELLLFIYLYGIITSKGTSLTGTFSSLFLVLEQAQYALGSSSLSLQNPRKQACHVGVLFGIYAVKI